MDRPAIPPDDILQGMNEWLNVRSTFKAVLDESEGSSSEDADDKGHEKSELEKRRDKRRRYRRRKRDRDLQEELLVRQQHLLSSQKAAQQANNRAFVGDAPPPHPPAPAPGPPATDPRPVAAEPAAAAEATPPKPDTPPPPSPPSPPPPAAAVAAAAPAVVPEQGKATTAADAATLPYGHGQGQGVGHNPAREDCCAWHFAPAHYDTTRPLYVRVCGLKAAIHIDERGTIWLNLSQLMKLVGKTKKQTLDLYGDDAFDPDRRRDVKLLDLKDGPKASTYVSEARARRLVIPFMGPTKSTNFLAELDRIHREFRVPVLDDYDTAEATVHDGGPSHTPLYLRSSLPPGPYPHTHAPDDDCADAGDDDAAAHARGGGGGMLEAAGPGVGLLAGLMAAEAAEMVAVGAWPQPGEEGREAFVRRGVEALRLACP